jgi:hypothetical protein
MSSPTRPSPRVARDAVDLQLADEPLGLAAQAARDAVAPRVELVEREHVVQRQHRRPVLDGREQLRRRGGADPLRRGIGRDQLGERILERT